MFKAQQSEVSVVGFLNDLRQLPESERSNTFKLRCVTQAYGRGSQLQRDVYIRCQQRPESLVIRASNRFQYLCPSFFSKDSTWQRGDNTYCPVIQDNEYHQDPLRPQIFPTDTQPGLIMQLAVLEMFNKPETTGDLVSSLNFVLCRPPTISLQYPYNYYFFLLCESRARPRYWIF